MNGLPNIAEWPDDKVEDTVRWVMFKRMVWQQRKEGNTNNEEIFLTALAASCDDVGIDIDDSRNLLEAYPSMMRTSPSCIPRPEKQRYQPDEPHGASDYIDYRMILSKYYDRVGYPKRRRYAN